MVPYRNFRWLVPATPVKRLFVGGFRLHDLVYKCVNAHNEQDMVLENTNENVFCIYQLLGGTAKVICNFAMDHLEPS